MSLRQTLQDSGSIVYSGTRSTTVVDLILADEDNKLEYDSMLGRHRELDLVFNGVPSYFSNEDTGYFEYSDEAMNPLVTIALGTIGAGLLLYGAYILFMKKTDLDIKKATEKSEDDDKRIDELLKSIPKPPTIEEIQKIVKDELITQRKKHYEEAQKIIFTLYGPLLKTRAISKMEDVSRMGELLTPWMMTDKLKLVALMNNIINGKDKNALKTNTFPDHNKLAKELIRISDSKNTKQLEIAIGKKYFVFVSKLGITTKVHYGYMEKGKFLLGNTTLTTNVTMGDINLKPSSEDNLEVTSPLKISPIYVGAAVAGMHKKIVKMDSNANAVKSTLNKIKETVKNSKSPDAIRTISEMDKMFETFTNSLKVYKTNFRKVVMYTQKLRARELAKLEKELKKDTPDPYIIIDRIEEDLINKLKNS